MRVFQGRVRSTAGVHDDRALAMIVLGGVEPPDDTHSMGQVSCVGQQFANSRAWNGSRNGAERPARIGAGLRVPGLKLAYTAAEPHQHNPLLLFREFGREGGGCKGSKPERSNRSG